jgi:DnaJ-class molecular chaperone
METNRCFEILELDHNASLEDARQAYRDQVKFFHPDRFANDPRQREKAEEKLKEVNEAYERVKVVLASKEETESVVVGKDAVKKQRETRESPVYYDVQQGAATKGKEKVGKGGEIIRSVSSFLSGALRRILPTRVAEEGGGQDMQQQGKARGKGRGKSMGRYKGSGRGRGGGRGKGRGGR